MVDLVSTIFFSAKAAKDNNHAEKSVEIEVFKRCCIFLYIVL